MTRILIAIIAFTVSAMPVIGTAFAWWLLVLQPATH